MHCGAGVSVGEGVEVSVTVVEGVGEAERDTVVVPVGVVDAEAPVDMVAERGVVVGESCSALLVPTKLKQKQRRPWAKRC